MYNILCYIETRKSIFRIKVNFNLVLTLTVGRHDVKIWDIFFKISGVNCGQLFNRVAKFSTILS